jgi:hypothetical protein
VEGRYDVETVVREAALGGAQARPDLSSFDVMMRGWTVRRTPGAAV